jgi:putative hydrolase of the HAD superfamily
MLAALVLDFDGLILDTETALLDAWERVHADHGQVYDRAGGHAVIGHSGMAYDPWAAFPVEHNREDLEQQFLKAHAKEITQRPILPGIIELLDAAAAANLALAVASNSPIEHVENHLTRLDLRDRFAVLATRDQVEEPKPAPDVYQLACRQFGVAPADCLAFEDSVPGHIAAHRAGLRVIVVPNPCTRGDDFPHAAQRLDSMAGFRLDDWL